MWRIFLSALLFALAAWEAPASANASAGAIYFDSSGLSTLKLGAAGYEFGFRKTNGSIEYILDKTSGQKITAGSRRECLWGAVFSVNGQPEYVGGCSYNKDWYDRFTYAWSAAQNTLTFTYTPDPNASRKVSAVVKITASETTWADFSLHIQNNYGSLLDYVLFPSEIVTLKSEIEQVLLPILPGVVLEPGFFSENRSYRVAYPGYPGVFADFIALKFSKGHLAIYSLYGSGPIREGWLGMMNDDDTPPYLAGSAYILRVFSAQTASGGSWQSPGVRIRVGEPFRDAVLALRVDNKMQNFTSVAQKAGDLYARLVQAPLYRAVADGLNLRFSQYADSLLSKVPIPGILHPVCYQPGGHDESQPDYLPPDPAYGTTQDLINMFNSVKGLGFLVMPYSNPTWWDDQSYTLTHLPAGTTLNQIAVIDASGNPVYEIYRHGSPLHDHGGYVMSLAAPFVVQRVDRLMQDLTVTLPSDMLFEDQIGARAWLYDYNPSAATPLTYITNWMNHTRIYKSKLLHTELAFDRLAETEVGFHGSVLLPEKLGQTSDWWGDGNWHLYPLATMLARDKTLFYQHDLAPETFTTNKRTLTWNMAMGYNLSYDLVQTSFGGGLSSDWIKLVGVFQKYALAAYAGERVTGYFDLAPSVTQTVFETCQVTANWSASAAYPTGEYTIPAQGAVVTCNNNRLTAGVFTTYNSAALSSGEHYLVERHSGGRIDVFQPIGGDTSLTLKNLPFTPAAGVVEAKAYTLGGVLIGSVPLAVNGDTIIFNYTRLLNTQSVGYVRFTGPALNTYLPQLEK